MSAPKETWRELREIVSRSVAYEHDRLRALSLLDGLYPQNHTQPQPQSEMQEQGAYNLAPPRAPRRPFRLLTSEAEEELLRYDVFALGIHGPQTVTVCMFFIAVGYLSPAVLNHRQIIVSGRAIFFFGHILAYAVYRRVIWKINESYTSYRGENNYGYTNVEKAVIRDEAKRIWRILLFRAIVAAIIHYRFLSWVTPLLVVSALGYGTLLNNKEYVSVFWNPFELKRPKEGHIPRSLSGRLL